MHTDGNIPPMPERGFYYHYKHDPEASFNNYTYEVMGVGHHSESDCRPEDQHLVVYRPLYKDAFVYRNGKMFDVRPLGMFMESVTKDGVEKSRFTKIEDTDVIEKLKELREEMYPKNLFD